MRTALRVCAPSLVLAVGACSLWLLQGCEKPRDAAPASSAPKSAPAPVSAVNVQVNAGGPLVGTTVASEVDLTPKGYGQAFRLRDGQRRTLDDPAAAATRGGVPGAGGR